MFKKLCLSLTASTALITGVAQASPEFFIRIAGITGTSIVRGFEEYIDVESWSLGFTRGLCQDLHFVKQMDASSGDLTAATLSGDFYPTASLVARKAGGDGSQFTYMRLTLSNSVFTSLQVGGSAGSSILPMEQVSLQPSSVKLELFKQLEGGGSESLPPTTVTCQKPK